MPHKDKHDEMISSRVLSVDTQPNHLLEKSRKWSVSFGQQQGEMGLREPAPADVRVGNALSLDVAGWPLPATR